ncbi:hypothetical protein B4U80_14670, partial [Leptotrombidium deliense]
VWWKVIRLEDRYGMLANVALRIHSVPESNCAVERIFSMQSSMHNKQANKLTNVTASKNVAIKHNLQKIQNVQNTAFFLDETNESVEPLEQDSSEDSDNAESEWFCKDFLNAMQDIPATESESEIDGISQNAQTLINQDDD